jgi:ribosomal protein S27AE
MECYRHDGPMKAHACGKCGSFDVLRVPGGRDNSQDGSGSAIRAGLVSVVPVSRYVCAACGFVEHWVDDPDDLTRLRKKYGG